MVVKKMCFRKLRKYWKQLESNPSVYPYQYYDLFRILKHHYFFYSLRNKEFPVFYAAFEGRNCLAVFPLCKCLSRGDKQCKTMGASASMQLNDAVYSESLTAEQMKEILQKLVQKAGTIRFCFVPEKSLLSQVLLGIVEPTRKNENVEIDASQPYEAYVASLSKNTRQNIRTAYNRLKSDEHSYEVETIADSPIPAAELQRLMDVYIERRNHHYEDVSSFRNWILRHYHFNTIALSALDNSIYVILKIDGKIAAFWGGYRDHCSSRVLIPRLAINDEFARYSPGALLINESMKILNTQYGLSVMDLSAGGEQYKYTMGGKMYYSYHFTLKSDQIH